MNELDLQTVRREILTFSDGAPTTNHDDTNDNNILQELIEDFKRRKYVSERLNNANTQSEYRHIARSQLSNEYAAAQLLPILGSYDFGELALLQATMRDKWQPSVIAITDQIIPVQTLYGEGNHIYERIVGTYGGNGITQDIFEYKVRYELMSDEIDIATISVVISTNNAINQPFVVVFARTVSVPNYDVLNITLCLQYVLLETVALNKTSDDNTLGLDVYDVSETFDLHVSMEFTIINANISLQSYNEPTIETSIIYDVVYNVTSIRDIVDLQLISIIGIGQPVVIISTPSYYQTRSKIEDELSLEYNTDLRRKFQQNRKMTGYQIQDAMYGIEYATIITNIQEQTDYDEDTLMSTIIENSAKLSDIASRVALYTDVEKSFMGDAWASLKLRGPSYAPAPYTISGDNNTGIFTIYRMTTGLNGTPAIRHKQILNISGSMDVDETTYVKIRDTNDSVVYAKITITRDIIDSYPVAPSTHTGNLITSSAYELQTFYDIGGSYLTLVQRTHVNNNGVVGIGFYPSVLTVMLDDIIICFKNAINFPLFIEGTMNYELYHDRESISGFTSEGDSGEFISDEYGRLYATFMHVGRAIYAMNNQVFDPVMRIQFPSNVNEILETRTQQGGVQDDKVYAQSLAAVSGAVLSMRTIKPSGESTPYVDLEFELIPTKEQMMDYTTASFGSNIIRDNVLWTDVTGNTNVGVNRYSWLRKQHVVIQVNGNVKVSAPMPPIDLGFRRYANEYQSLTETVLQTLMSDVAGLTEDLSDLRNQVERLWVQFEQFMRSLETSVVDMIVDHLLSAAMNMIMPMVTSALVSFAKEIKKASGLALRSTSLSLRSMKGAKGIDVSYKKTNLPIDSIVEPQTFNDAIIYSLGKKKPEMITATSRPLYKQQTNAQDIDRVDKMDLVTEVKTGGRLHPDYQYDEKALMSLVPEKNVSYNERLLPTLQTYYRPLEILPEKISKALHKLTDTQGFRNKMRDDALNITTRKPSHAFSVYTDYEYLPNGKYEMKRTYFGVGEANVSGKPTGDKGAGIGGVHTTYEAFCKSRDGTILFTPRSYQETGYDDIQLDNIYKTLFKKDRPAHISRDSAWIYITDELDRKIISSDMMHHTTVPDRSIGRVIRDMVDNPPEFQYSLLYRNCQDVAKDIINFAKGLGLPRKWDLSLQAKYTQTRVHTFVHAIGESDAIIRLLSKFEALRASRPHNDFRTLRADLQILRNTVQR